jgi:hypothetical protein
VLLICHLNAANVTIKNATAVFPDTGSNFSSEYSDIYYNNNFYTYETSDASLSLTFAAIPTDSSITDGSVITWASYNDLFTIMRPVLNAEISTLIQWYFGNYSLGLVNNLFVYNFNINTLRFKMAE